MELADRVHKFERPLGAGGVLRVYLIVGKDCVVMMDTAMIGFEDMVHEALELVHSSGLPLKFVVNTHAHHDHIGLNSLVQADSGAWILAHRWGIPWIVDPGRNYREFALGNPHIISDSPALRDEILGTMGTGCSVDIGVVGGELLDIGKCHLEIVDLSGHVSGEIGLLMKKEKLLLIGDAFTGMDLGFFHGHMRPALYRQTLKRVRRLVDKEEVTEIHSIHLPPLVGRQAIYHAIDSRESFLNALDAAIIEEVSDGSRTLEEIWRAVSLKWHKDPEFRGLSMVQVHLEELCHGGTIEQAGQYFWKAS